MRCWDSFGDLGVICLNFGAAHKWDRYLVLLGNHHLGVWCLRKLDGFCLVLLLDGGLYLVMFIKVGDIWSSSQISQILVAVNNVYCFSLVLPDKLNTFSLVLQPN
jgi:hypothetical protein